MFSLRNNFRTGLLLAGSAVLLALIVWEGLVLANQFLPSQNAGLGAQYMPTDLKVIAEARRVYEACANTGMAHTTCYENPLVALVNTQGFLYAEATLMALQDIDEAAQSCHVIAHKIGSAAYRKDPTRWKEMIKGVNVQACASGFLHGILEAHLAGQPDFRVTSAFINEICGGVGEAYRNRMCAHFMGHIGMLETLGDLPKALPVCKTVKDNLQFDCYDGVFMEDHQKVVMSQHDIMPGPVYNEKYVSGLVRQCEGYAGLLRKTCWVEMGEVYAKLHQYDAHLVYQSCYGDTKTEADGRACYDKGIVVLATYPLPRTSQQMVNICDPFAVAKEKYLGCLGSAFDAFMYYSPKFVSRGITLCESGKPEYAEACFQLLGEKLQPFIPVIADREALCSPAAERYRKLCVMGNAS